MANKKIESRYTIEYIYPDSTPTPQNKTSSNIGAKLFFTTSILGLVAIGVATSVYYPTSTTNQNTTALIDTQDTEDVVNDFAIDTENEEPTGIISAEKEQVLKEVEELTQKNKAQLILSTKQEVENEKLLQKLNVTNNQLLMEKEKNKKLNSSIESNISKNSELSQMLKEAVSKANTADKRYLDALLQLEVNTSIPTSKEEETIIEEKLVTDDIAKQIPTESKDTNNKNSVSLSNATQSQVDVIIAAMGKGDSNTINQPNPAIETMRSETKVQEEKTINLPKKPLSQVDAIVAAMGQVNLSPNRKSINKSTTPSIIIQTSGNTDVDVEAESLHIRLQKQINNLIKTNELQTTDYKEALTTESVVRSNAVRSITVRKGDTLWDIARRAYGNGSFYKKIIDANPEITKKGKIYLREGQVIHVPI